MPSSPKVITKPLIHGRETYIADFGPGFVMKRPLPTFGDAARDTWLAKQHKTKDAIDRIYAVGNPRYNIPRMLYIKDDEYQLLEERAPGEHLTAQLYSKLSRRQRYEIIDGIAAFLVDMNESQPIGNIINHKISKDLKFSRLDNFVNNKMDNWFTLSETQNLGRIRDAVGTFEYETRQAWSHGDLNSGNVLYDPQTSTLSFIDFAESDYNFIYRDIFGPLQIELDIWTPVYDAYSQMHNKDLYNMPGPRNPNLRNIMKYRILITLLRRIIKASDDLRMNPKNQKSIDNNNAKLAFIREQLAKIDYIEQAFRASSTR
ncbi:MAG: phosphotransferase [Alphaproteobacteria bacterium]|nr:phosphotransferase [Alphaproteobacteria bacterium]